MNSSGDIQGQSLTSFSMTHTICKSLIIRIFVYKEIRLSFTLLPTHTLALTFWHTHSYPFIFWSIHILTHSFWHTCSNPLTLTHSRWHLHSDTLTLWHLPSAMLTLPHSHSATLTLWHTALALHRSASYKDTKTWLNREWETWIIIN